VAGWRAADPAQHSFSLAHRSSLAPGLHGHGFTGASATLEVGSGGRLFSWVYLDPAHPPREIMLSWHDGSSWEHRAYWGANLITYGTSGSPGRFNVGALPPAGKWVQLGVPADAVGLGRATLSGMTFSLVDGRATWGPAGRSR
jgi:hypothetical protein